MLNRLLFGKEGETMIAKLWATQIIAGKKTYADVPRLLKDKVKEALAAEGHADLVTE